MQQEDTDYAFTMLLLLRVIIFTDFFVMRNYVKK
jgi:hypothetical protein